eukprot:2025017-Pleurochrysis_carterae.AAC.1
MTGQSLATGETGYWLPARIASHGGHGLCITGHGSAQGCDSHLLDWSLSSADQQAREFEKGILRNALGEHIRNVVRSWNKGHGHDFVGNAVMNEVPATLDVLCLFERRRVVRQGDGSLVVHEQSGGLRLFAPMSASRSRSPMQWVRRQGLVATKQGFTRGLVSEGQAVCTGALEVTQYNAVLDVPVRATG